MIWRALALIVSLTVGSTATFALWVYLIVAHDLNSILQLLLLFLAFAAFWYGAWTYLLPSGSVSEVRSRSKTLSQFLIGGSAALLGLWLLGVVRGSGDVGDTTLTCDTCPIMQVTRVIDGDTFVSGATRVRLYGIDTPEVGERCAEGATDRLRQLVGSRVRIEDGPRSQDRYGRLLGYVYTEDGASIDELLVVEGHAVAWTQDGQHRDLLVRLERDARISGKGCLW